jgi:hypothetical protein
MFCVEDYEVESEQARKQDEQNKRIVEAQGVFATLVHARQSVNPLGGRTAGSTIERDALPVLRPFTRQALNEAA